MGCATSCLTECTQCMRGCCCCRNKVDPELEAEIKRLQRENDRLEKELNDLRNTHNEMTSELRAQISRLQREKEQLRSELNKHKLKQEGYVYKSKTISQDELEADHIRGEMIHHTDDPDVNQLLAEAFELICKEPQYIVNDCILTIDGKVQGVHFKAGDCSRKYKLFMDGGLVMHMYQKNESDDWMWRDKVTEDWKPMAEYQPRKVKAELSKDEGSQTEQKPKSSGQ